MIDPTWEASSWRPKLLGANPSNQLREDSNIYSRYLDGHRNLEDKVQYSLKTVLLLKTSNIGRKYLSKILTGLKFSNLKRKTLDSSIPAAQQPDSSTPAAQQPDRNKISAILGPAGLTINAQLLPLACFSTMTLNKRVPSQPRSPCELPPADHPHRPESHQQSRCPFSSF